jgi:hypothetical protein
MQEFSPKIPEMITINLSTLIKIALAGFLVVSVIILGLLINKFFTKQKFMDFLLSVVFPKPFFGAFGTKIINKLVKNSIIDAVIQLREEMIKRFGSVNTTPIALDIYTEIKIKNIGDASVYFEADDISWCVNNKMSVIHISKEKLPIVMPILQNLFDGMAVQSLIIHFNESDKDIGNICDLVFSITKTVMPVVLIYNGDHMKLQSLSGVYNSKESIGFNIEVEDNLQSLFIDFIHDIINKSVHGASNLNQYFPQDIFFLKSISEIVCQNAQYVENSEMFLRGMYFITYNKLELKSEVNFTDDLFNKIIYSLCNEAKMIDKFSNARQNFFLRFIITFTWMICSIVVYFSVQSIIKQQSNIELSMQISNSILNKEHVDENKVLEHIKGVHSNKLSLLTRFLLRKDVDHILYIRNFLISNSTKIFEKIDDIDKQEIFNYSPIETHMFQKLDFNVRNLTEALQNLSSFTDENNSYKMVDDKMNQYVNICQDKIISNFTNFFNQFNKFVLFDHATEFSNKIQLLFNQPSVENIKNVMNMISQLKNLCHLSSNSWWINGDLGAPFNQLKKMLKKIPKVGGRLEEEVNFMSDKALKTIKSNLLDFDILNLGKLFAIENEKLTLSSDVISFYNHCNILLQEELIQLPTKDLTYIIPDSNEVSLWELDVLDRILQKISLRDEFLKRTTTYPLEMRNLSIIMADRNLAEYIKSSLCEAQKISTYVIPITQKAQNIGQAVEKIDKIKHFFEKTLGFTMPHFVDFLVSDLIMKICGEFRDILNNSNFTAYTKLDQWKGEDIVYFLFQCRREDVPFVISKSISNLNDLKDSVLIHIMSRLPYVNQQEYLFIKQIYNEITAYLANQKNQIAPLEALLNELSSWQIKWADPNIKYSAKEDFFAYHEKAFRKALIVHTNKLLFNQSKIAYNRLVDYFNTHLAGRYPFGDKEKASNLDIARFLNMYLECRDKLKIDNEFLQLKLPISLKELDDLCDFLIIENDNVFINAKVQYHLPEGKNLYLVKNYFSRFGEAIMEGDNIEYKTKASNGFTMGLEIINSSRLKIKTKGITGNTDLSTRIKFDYLEEYGFLSFIKHFIVRKRDKEAVLKVVIPLGNNDNSHIDELICYIKILNYPHFFSHMDRII